MVYSHGQGSSVRTSFKRMMLCASALSWVLVSLMPVINTHGSNAGVWETLCTVNGFELVLIEDSDEAAGAGKHHGKPCPFSHFSTSQHVTLTATDTHTYVKFSGNQDYTLLAQRVRFESPIARAPPLSVSFHT